MSSLKPLFRHEDAIRPTIGATVYCVGAWAGGLLLLVFTSNPLLLALGALMLAHGMVIAAYMLHECAHQAVFKKREHNALAGEFFSWLTGSCYNRFDQIRHKHMRHHVDNADIVAVDYRSWLQERPGLLRVVRFLEWLYIPAVELILHGMMVCLPFLWESRRKDRTRTLTVVLIRGSLFVTLVWISPIAALLYIVAYLIFLTVLRFMDAFQHNYDFFTTLDDKNGSPYKGDRVYEQTHTFSNLISLKYPLLNLVTLNFCYHNAHHERPTAPWYQLPALHRDTLGEEDQQTISIGEQLRAFHRQRIPRILSLTDESTDFRERMALGRAVGADGVSFLTAL